MKIIIYEIKKILNIKLCILFLAILGISIFFFARRISIAGEELDIVNTKTLIDRYGYELTDSKSDELVAAFEEHYELMDNEFINQEALISGEMSREDFAAYAEKLARTKRFIRAWDYINTQKSKIEGTNGWIIINEYWKKFFEDGLFQPSLLLITFFIALLIALSDRGTGIFDILVSTPKGKSVTCIYKMITSGILIFLSSIIYYGAMVLFMSLTEYGNYIKSPVASIEIYNAGNMSIITYLIIFILVISLIYAIVGTLINFVLMTIKIITTIK